MLNKRNILFHHNIIISYLNIFLIFVLLFNINFLFMVLRIRDIIREKNLSIVWLSSQIGITQPNMSNIVSGKLKPSLDTLERIAAVLGVHISELFAPPAASIINCPKCGARLKFSEE